MRRRDPGVVSAEVAIIAPALIAVALFVHYAGNAVTTRSRVHHAAVTAARAATLVRVSAMPAIADDTARRTLGENGVACASHDVDVTVDAGADPRVVVVRVECTLDQSPLSFLGLQPRNVSAEVSEVVDRWRAEP
jgi:Flp pilus assembly protein TadG